MAKRFQLPPSEEHRDVTILLTTHTNRGCIWD
uniref:Uncharacterized protein n=1 Tax=Arundo donax TaxID=35708 RepID=A0A0A9HDS0_ARUDO